LKTSASQFELSGI